MGSPRGLVREKQYTGGSHGSVPASTPRRLSRAQSGCGQQWVGGGEGGGWEPPVPAAPSGPFLVGVAARLCYSKARPTSAGRSFPVLFMSTCVSASIKKIHARTRRGRRAAPPRPAACVYQQWACVTASDVFQLAKSPLPSAGSTSGRGHASPPSRARRPPSYKETSRGRRPSRAAPDGEQPLRRPAQVSGTGSRGAVPRRGHPSSVCADGRGASGGFARGSP